MSDADSAARPTVYVETSVISYLAAKPSGDLITRARPKATRDWWSRTARWELVVSAAVLREAILGDHSTAVKRLELGGSPVSIGGVRATSDLYARP